MLNTAKEAKVLDHGYVKLVEAWGSDERIIEAARMSTQKGFEGWGDDGMCLICGEKDLSRKKGRCRAQPVSEHDWQSYAKDADGPGGDEKLLSYLWKNNHATPFEMSGVVIEVQAPIFVFREWHRHRTQSYNEMSARYAPLPDVNYVPTVARVLMNGGHLTKQAAGADGAKELSPESALDFLVNLKNSYTKAEQEYQAALSAGIPKELARLSLPVGRYSRMRASANLRNWLGFLTLRMAPQAQWEIRQYANAVNEILKPLFPRTMKLFGASS